MKAIASGIPSAPRQTLLGAENRVIFRRELSFATCPFRKDPKELSGYSTMTCWVSQSLIKEGAELFYPLDSAKLYSPSTDSDIARSARPVYLFGRL